MNASAVGVAVLVVALAVAPAQAQDRLRMKVYLGAPTALEVDLEYHDPAELDRRLGNTRVVPIWMTLKNVASEPVTVNYRDVRLDLGGGPGQPLLVPVDADDARARLRQDGHHAAIARLLADRDRISGDPFSPRLRDGSLAPGQSKSGYVFFFRSPGVPFNGVMSIATAGHLPELLTTAAVEAPDAGPASRSADMVTRILNALGPIVNGPPPFGESYAILFGIYDYERKAPLKGVAADIQSMRDYLRLQGFKPAVVKVNREVTAATLRDIQRHFEFKLKPQDRLLVYYAGHGMVLRDRGYLVLSASGDTFDDKTNIPMDEFVSWMQRLPVKHLLVILDACFAGAAIPGSTRDAPPMLERADQQLLYQLASGKARFVAMAATDTQRANEDRDGGLFTKSLLRSLKERQPTTAGRLITSMEAFSRARAMVLDEVRNRNLPPQFPLLRDLGVETPVIRPGAPPSTKQSDGEFVFVRMATP